MADVKVGTPAQTLTLQLDTGSSDTWVVYTSSSVCEKGDCKDGSFDPNQSSTFSDLAKGAFEIAYADKTSAKGDYFNDVFSIGGTTLQNLTMGIGIDTDIPFGLLGVGFAVNEAGVESGVLDSPYYNLPVQMVQEGFTKTVAYSMWLNDLAASTGTILFGGIDTAKFDGPLTRLKLYSTKDKSTINEFAVALTSVTAVSKSGTDKLGSATFPAAVVLDSGSTVSYLPADLAQEMYKEAGATVDSDGTPAVPCAFRNSKAYFSFGFGGPSGAVVNVSMSELVLGLVGNYTSGPNKGQDACQFGVLASDAPLILGDSFLRSAFVVYDLINKEVALAQAKLNVTDSNVVAFASLSATIPSSTPAPNEDQIDQGIVSATPTTYAAAPGFTASSGASRLGGRGVDFAGVTLAALLSLGVGFIGFLTL